MKIFRKTNLVTEKIGKRVWKITDALIYSTPIGTITVPVGFITDGASTPKALYSLCPPMSGLGAEAAVLHDYLYSKDSATGSLVKRKLADEYFRAGMLGEGMNKFKANTIYYGVRAFGKSSYKKGYSKDKLKD